MDNSCRNCKNNEFGKCVIIEDIFKFEVFIKDPESVKKFVDNLPEDIKNDTVIKGTTKVSIKNIDTVIAKIKDNSFKCRLWE